LLYLLPENLASKTLASLTCTMSFCSNACATVRGTNGTSCKLSPGPESDEGLPCELCFCSKAFAAWKVPIGPSG